MTRCRVVYFQVMETLVLIPMVQITRFLKEITLLKYSGGAVKFINGTTDTIISGNIVRSTGGTSSDAAFHIASSDRNEIVNNLIIDSPAAAIYIENSTDVQVINNTIFKTRGSAIWISNQNEAISLHNNIVDNSQSPVDCSN